MPIIGPMFRKVTISRSIRTLGTMIASGVPMLEAIRLTAEVAGNYYYEQAVAARARAGHRRATGSANRSQANTLFPPMLVQMIAAGEETGKLDKVLDKVSNYYDHEVETSLKTATSMIEPIMISVMGVIVGGIGMACCCRSSSSASRPANEWFSFALQASVLKLEHDNSAT